MWVCACACVWCVCIVWCVYVSGWCVGWSGAEKQPELRTLSGFDRLLSLLQVDNSLLIGSILYHI